MPKAGSVVKFTNLYKQNPVNYTIYGDFECIMDKTTGVHTPCGYATLAINSKGERIRFSLYRGKDCVEQFFEELGKIRKAVDEIPTADEIITAQQQEEFDSATQCYLCGGTPVGESIDDNDDDEPVTQGTRPSTKGYRDSHGYWSKLNDAVEEQKRNGVSFLWYTPVGTNLRFSRRNRRLVLIVLNTTAWLNT